MAQVPPSPLRDKTLARMRSPFKFWLFQWLRLPAAARAGVRLDEVDYKRAIASVPYKNATKNPFRSTYFACLAMAAEMSTGIIALLATTGNSHSVAMLVANLEGTFVKKATGEPVIVKANTIGRNKAGEEIARFTITWSFKRRG